MSSSLEEYRLRRLMLDRDLRRRHREQLVTAKRYRFSDVEESDQSADEEAPDLTPLKANLQASGRQSQPVSTDENTRIAALQELSDRLVEPVHNVKVFVMQEDAVALLQRSMESTNADEQLAAVWCITNIAAGPPDMCKKTLDLIPKLAPLLKSDNVSLKDQAAWALGNIAAEDEECRQLLRDESITKPLIDLLDSQDPGLIQTACFAISNILRGPHARVSEVISYGVVDKLMKLLSTEEMSEIVSEICWVLCYLTSFPEAITTKRLQDGLAAMFVKHMPTLATRGPLGLSLVRTLGNIASGPDEDTDALLAQPGFLQGMIGYVQSDCRPVRKEALRVVSNITAARKPDDLRMVIDAGFLPILTGIATHSNFDIRKEAAFSLINIASHGEQYVRALPHRDLLPAFMEFVQSDDPELQRLGLSYLELLFHMDPEGKSLFDASNMSSESLENIAAGDDKVLRKRANELLNLVYNEHIEDGTPQVGTPAGEMEDVAANGVSNS